MPVNNSNIPAVKTPVMVLYEKVGNGNVQFSPAASVEGGFRVTLCEYKLKYCIQENPYVDIARFVDAY